MRWPYTPATTETTRLREMFGAIFDGSLPGGEFDEPTGA